MPIVHPALRRWLCAIALLFWPARVRSRHRRALSQTFDAAWTAEATRRLPVRAWRRLRLVLDTVSAGLAERRHERARLNRDSGRPALWPRLYRSGASDLRAALRALSARPLFASVVVITLGLGLGSSTAIFAVVDAVLLRPLPFPDDQQLVRLGERDAGRNLTGASIPALLEWTAFPEVQAIGAFEVSARLFNSGGLPERVNGASVSPGFFATLSVDAAFGRTIEPGGPLFEPEPRIVLGHGVWQRHYGGDPGIVGRAVVIENFTATVIGVMPAGFSFPAGTEFWRTMPAEMQMLADARTLKFLEVVARMAPGASVDDVASSLAAWQSAQPPDEDPWTVFAVTVRDEARGGVAPALVTVFIGVGLLLLVACANVMALLLANGRARSRDLAVRTALGAGRARLVRQLMLEGALLSLGASVLALAATRVTRALVLELSADQIPRIDGFAVTPGVVVFALTSGLVAAALVTVWPAWSLTRAASGAGALRGSRAEVGRRGSRRLFGGLVAFEFAMAVMLVAGAGLLFGGYQRLAAVDAGIAPDRVGVARVVMPLGGEWQPNERRRQFFEDLRARLGAVPGIEAVSFVSRLPLDPSRGGSDVSAVGAREPSVQALSLMASPGYFETVGARVSAGRGFTDADHSGAPRVTVINRLVADRLFGSAPDAIDRQINMPYFTGDIVATVVGVVEPIRYDDLASDLRPELYLPTGQGTVLPLSLVYRTSGNPAALVPSIRAAVAEVDATSSVALDEIATLDGRLARTVARPRFFLVLVGVFAALAGALATCGVYGTTSYWLAESRREVGLRLALGATPGQVRRQVTARGVGMALFGVVVGLAGFVLVSGLLSRLLVGFESVHLPTLLAAGSALVAAGLAATWWPARRVFEVDPADMLRD